MGEVVYVLCAATSALCAVMLLLGYRRTRSHMLLWSCLCFVFLAGANIVLVVDMLVFPQVDISGQFWRNLLSATAGSLLLIGLISELT